MHDGKTYYSMHNAISDLRKDTTDPERGALLDQLEQSVVVAHSLSKAGATAGDRAAYFASKNPELLSAVYNQIIDVILTPSRGTLAAVKGFMDKGEVDHESMKRYGQRLRYFENELNKIVPDAVPARADAGFFITTNFSALKGAKIDDATVAQLRSQIEKIPNKTLHQEFGEIFKDGKVNNSVDAALWLMAKANVVAIPIVSPTGNDGNMRLRFSVGQTDIPMIRQALDRIEAAIGTLDLAKSPKGVAIGV
jgi:aspartate/methionine/tyrosine aminotransferase